MKGFDHSLNGLGYSWRTTPGHTHLSFESPTSSYSAVYVDGWTAYTNVSAILLANGVVFDVWLNLIPILGKGRGDAHDHPLHQWPKRRAH
jgi:hypothetical protein